jgi:hypothetical protein
LTGYRAPTTNGSHVRTLPGGSKTGSASRSIRVRGGPAPRSRASGASLKLEKVRTELTNQGLARSQVSRGREIFLKLKKIVDRQNAATMIRDPEAAR